MQHFEMLDQINPVRTIKVWGKVEVNLHPSLTLALDGKNSERSLKGMRTPAQMSRRTDVQEILPDGWAMWLLSSILEALASRKQGTRTYTLIIIIIIDEGFVAC